MNAAVKKGNCHNCYWYDDRRNILEDQHSCRLVPKGVPKILLHELEVNWRGIDKVSVGYWKPNDPGFVGWETIRDYDCWLEANNNDPTK